MKFVFFCFILIHTLCAWSSSGLLCRNVTGLTEVNDLSIVAKEYRFYGVDSRRSTFQRSSVVSVEYRGARPSGHIVFRRHHDYYWAQDVNVLPDGFTKQGNPLHIIALLGPNIAQLLDFRIYQTSDGTQELWVPDADHLNKSIQQTNVRLVSRGLEPISYSVQSTGFLTNRQILELTSQSDGPVEIKFAFADRHPRLAVHEVSYHLGAMTYPKIILKRARLINQKYLQMMDLLKAHFPKEVDSLIEQLEKDRALEMDFGTANPQIYLQSLKDFDFQFDSLSSEQPALQRNIDSDIAAIAEGFTQLAHFGFTPSEVVIMKLLSVLSLHDTNTYRDLAKGRTFYEMSLYGFGSAVRLSASPQLRKFVLDEVVPIFLKQAQSEIGIEDRPVQEVVSSMLKNFPARMKNIEMALIDTKRTSVLAFPKVENLASVEKSIIKLNREFKSRGFDEISLLPAALEYRKSKQQLENMVRGKSGFAAAMPLLRDHFVLNPKDLVKNLLYPSSVIERMQQINLRLLEAVNILERYKDQPGVPKAIDVLIGQRLAELEDGFFSSHTHLQNIKTAYLYEVPIDPYVEDFVQSLSPLAHFNESPSDLIAQRVKAAFGLSNASTIQTSGLAPISYKLRLILEMEVLPKILKQAPLDKKLDSGEVQSRFLKEIEARFKIIDGV